MIYFDSVKRSFCSQISGGYLFIVLFTVLISLSCCDDSLDFSVNNDKSTDFSVALDVNSYISDFNFEGVNIQLTGSDRKFILNSPIKNNIAYFSHIPIGKYDISLNIEDVLTNEMVDYLGVNLPFNISGAILDFEVYGDMSKDINLYVEGFHKDSLLIRTIYATGSGQSINRDHYIEIYNNSDSDIDLGNISLAAINHSLNDTCRVAIDDSYLKVSSVITIPVGTILKPREIYTIAANAQKFYYTDKYDNIKIDVDLLGANLEVFAQDYLTAIGSAVDSEFDTDNLSVANAKVNYLNGRFWHLSPYGTSLLLFQSGGDIDYDNVVVHDDVEYLKLPYSDIKIFDAVEFLPVQSNNLNKVLHRLVDKSFTSIDLGKYNQDNIYSRYRVTRKILNSPDDLLRLMDTNDSKDDFKIYKPI